MASLDCKITGLEVKDVRFPTSLGHHGSDAMVTKLYLVTCTVNTDRQNPVFSLPVMMD